MLICNFYGQCEISMKNRHACPACRLAKCFKWGMTTDKFRPSRQIKPKTIISLRLQARCQPERLPTLTLLQSDKSILTNDEWVFFTNLFNYFKECPVFSIAQQLIRMPDGFQSSYRIYSENNSLYYSNMSKDLTNPIHILEIQNKYAEVAWKYLLYRYCYRESVKRFLNLIIWLTSINILLAHARTLVLHVNDIDCVIEQTELTFILDDVDEIVERNE
ncbi:unnamed protein product [Rotaria socialis]|uniref:Nuclear receptor domain-containing protein n=1 Tax=Rotaria socialis TaxID=392032 RepID=A0A817VWR7_9BILA|nr:unnamed protein product [Rotaria socialis]CAF3394454.1 unnamed protein product [Rotaria socialis]